MMRFEHNFYLTHDRSQDVEFLFVNIGSGWRAYILSDIVTRILEPSHMLTEQSEELKNKVRGFLRGTRADVEEDRPVYYVCWSKDVPNLDTMRKIARNWAEITAYGNKHQIGFDAAAEALKTQGIL